MDKRKTFKGRLKLWEHITGTYPSTVNYVSEVSKHYWKVYHKDVWAGDPCFVRPAPEWNGGLRKRYVGLRAYYLKYFGQVVNVKYHRKYPHIVQIYSNKGMFMMDAFECWFAWIKDIEPYKDNTWDELFKL